MNNFKSCVPCVCTGSDYEWVCEEHNISIINNLCPKYDTILTLPIE